MAVRLVDADNTLFMVWKRDNYMTATAVGSISVLGGAALLD